VTELRRFARELQVVRGRCLVDVGCGRGGPGLWVAAVTGARLIGVDTDETALAAARHRAGQVGMADRADFRSGSFEATGLPGGSAQVADHRPLLDQAGFDILSYEETEAWRDRQERTGRALLAAAAELAAESGGKAAQRAASIAEINAALACVIRRVLVIARRRPDAAGPADGPAFMASRKTTA
jgi:SAM-dependent methyltransferase